MPTFHDPDKFTFMLGQLKKVTDPDVLEKVYQKTGFRPYSDEKQQYISEQMEKRWGEPGLDSFLLADEYDRLHAEGKI